MCVSRIGKKGGEHKAYICTLLPADYSQQQEEPLSLWVENCCHRQWGTAVDVPCKSGLLLPQMFSLDIHTTTHTPNKYTTHFVGFFLKETFWLTFLLISLKAVPINLTTFRRQTQLPFGCLQTELRGESKLPRRLGSAWKLNKYSARKSRHRGKNLAPGVLKRWSSS